MNHSVEEPGKVNRPGCCSCLPPRQETYLSNMTADFLRRTERMRFIFLPTRTFESGLILFSRKVWRHLEEGAHLRLKNTALKTEFKTTSSAQGLYSFQSLAVGRYDLTIGPGISNTEEDGNYN
jgi:hypothetical protein